MTQKESKLRCLVTGGQGFIGSHMVELLLENNYEVIVIDDQSAPENTEFYSFKGNVEYYNASITDESTHDLYKGVDYVFHFAARSRIQPSLVNPKETFENNVVGTQSVLQASRTHGIKKVVYSGSSSFYGRNNVPPHVETMQSDCLNPYSLSKFQGEQLCKMYSNLWNLKTVVLRYFNVYGPREPLKGVYAPVVGIFKRQRDEGEMLTIVGDGMQRRDFTYVKDVVNANLLAAKSEVVHDVFNIGTGTNYSINDVALMVGGKTAFIPPRPAEAKETLANISKAKQILGYAPKYKLEEMINSY